MVDEGMIMMLISIILISGCTQQTETTTTTTLKETDFNAILNQKDPELCLAFENEIINESLAKQYVQNIKQREDEILFKDLCLIYTISIVEHPDESTLLKPNVNDNYIALCNEASERNYTFLEESWYNIPAWEFCFRKAFNTYKSFSRPPNLGEIRNIETCENLKGFKDECLWLVAMNNNDITVCDLISSENRTEMCKDKIG